MLFLALLAPPLLSALLALLVTPYRRAVGWINALLFRAGFAAGRPWLMGAVLVLLTVAFVALVGHLHRMLYGSRILGMEPGERQRLGLVPLGLTLPEPVATLLDRTVEVIGR